MESSEKKGKSRSSDTKRELVAESSACENTEIAAEGAPVDDEKEVQDIMSIVTDLKCELEHSRKLRESLQKEVEELRAAKEAAETLADNRNRECEQLTADLAASEEERGEAVKEISRSRADSEEKKRELQRIREDLKTLENTLEAAKQEARSIKYESHEKIGQLKQDTVKLEERLKQKSQELSREIASIDDLKREKKQLEGEVAHLTKTRANLKKIHDSLKSVQQICSFSESGPRKPKEKE